MESLKSFNLAVRFILELCMLAALAYWGFKTGTQTIAKIGLGIGTPLAAALIWGTFLAPAAANRLSEPWLWLAEIVLFGAAITALYIVGKHPLAISFGLVYVINKVLLIIWKQ